jgi:hypothetical protein
MPKLEFTQAEVDSYANGSYKYCYRECSEKDAEELCVHADGLKPTLLLCTRRPNEPLEVKEYRESIWEPITREPISKVISSLQKIRRSPDWVIKYPDQTQFGRITEGATLEDYCETNFPYFRSLTNWLFALYLRKSLIDANSVVLVRPLVMPDKFGYPQPIPTIFDSCHVIEMVEDDYCVLWNPLGCSYYDDKQELKYGKSFYIITTMSIYRYDQEPNNKFVIREDGIYNHNLGILPAFKVPAMIKDAREGRFYNQSRIEGMVCHLNEAAREYSDLQAAKVNHMYPERWEYTQNQCADCSGLGRRNNPLFLQDPNCGCPAVIECTTCAGRGFKVAGPYAKIMVTPLPNTENGNIPLPPAGYIEKDVEIIKVQEQSVDAHIYKALSSVNMEYLAQVPLVQSGTAKEVDRSESANTVHSVAEDLVSAMDRIYYITAKYRYGSPNVDGVVLYPDDEIIDMLPQIPVPERFDLMTAAQSLTEIKLAKDGKANPLILNAMERDFAEKRFATDPEISDQLMLELELDPLPNISEDDKNSRLQNNGITQETYVISSNIHEFVERAIIEDPAFPSLRPELQREKMMEYAQEMMNESTTKIVNIGDAEPIVTGNNQNDQQIPTDVQPATTGSAAIDAQGSAQGTAAA